MLLASKICVRYLSWGPSINDVTLKEGGGCANVEIWGDVTWRGCSAKCDISMVTRGGGQKIRILG